MENSPVLYSTYEEILEVTNILKERGAWPEGRSIGRATMMRRRLALLAMGVKLPPISL